jgi:hypothetical protein
MLQMQPDRSREVRAGVGLTEEFLVGAEQPLTHQLVVGVSREQNTFTENVFRHNRTSVRKVLGSGENAWTLDGRGNDWGDPAVFDLDAVPAADVRGPSVATSLGEGSLGG